MRGVFERFESLLVEATREGIADGEFRSGTDPEYVAWRLVDLGLFRNQVHLMRLSRPQRIGYGPCALESLLAEIAA